MWSVDGVETSTVPANPVEDVEDADMVHYKVYCNSSYPTASLAVLMDITNVRCMALGA